MTQKAEWVHSTVITINLPMFPGCVEDLLKCSKSSNFCFNQAIDLESINSETVNIHYSAHQFVNKKDLDREEHRRQKVVE